MSVTQSLNCELTAIPRTWWFADRKLFGIGYFDVDILDVGDVFVDRNDLEIDFLTFFQIKVWLLLHFYIKNIRGDYSNGSNKVFLWVALDDKFILIEFFLRFFEDCTEVYVLLLIIDLQSEVGNGILLLIFGTTELDSQIGAVINNFHCSMMSQYFDQKISSWCWLQKIIIALTFAQEIIDNDTLGFELYLLLSMFKSHFSTFLDGLVASRQVVSPFFFIVEQI